MNDQDGNTQDKQARRDVILVVDDQAINRRLLAVVLEPHYQVLTAAGGVEALSAVHASPRPDLLLLDVMMPDMDGFEVLARLRTDEATRDIPVILVTALADDEHELTGFEAGAADYIHKPICTPIVLARVRAQLEAKSARDMLFKNNLHLRHKVEGGVRALETAQIQLMHAEKMASLGQLAAGIAHEINNPIGFVSSNLGSLERYLLDVFALVEAYERGVAASADPSVFAAAAALRQALDYDFLRDDARQLLVECRDGIDRVRKIVQDLKGYSHVSGNDWQWADLHAGLDSTLNIARNELKYHCTVIREYGDIPQVCCMPSQINQVFMNLLINAAHAIEGRGEIIIHTARLGDEAVRIDISDTGKGIPPENLSRIFEPFFTTKKVGEGTGLGLALSWNIVERHHGRLEVNSELGKGTTFTLTLPVVPPDAEN